MRKHHFEWSEDWSFGFRIWVARSGRTVLGKGRFELLAAIDRTNSISAAARQLGMSYRHAWVLVQEINSRAGAPLVEAATGGKHGGGAQLTDFGRMAVEFFGNLHAKVGSGAAAALGQTLKLPPQPDCVHLLAAVSLQEVVGEVVAEYARRHPHVRVRSVFGASNELADHLLNGMTADLFLSANRGELDRLHRSGLIAPGVRRVLASNGLAALAGHNSLIEVCQPADLLKKQVRRIVLADPQTPLGQASVRFLQHEGVYEALLPRVTHVDNSRAVLAVLRSGRADVGLAFGSEAASGGACRVLFQTHASHARSEYLGCVLDGSPRPVEAGKLLRYFHSVAARQAFRRCGFRIGTQRRARVSN